MMTNADSPAFPQPEVHAAGTCTGLTKREYLAGLAMQALLTNDPAREFDKIAYFSVLAADTILLKLEQTKTKQPNDQKNDH